MANIQYIGPLSRFSITNHQSPITNPTYDVVAVLSGLEPHRSLLEQDILARFTHNPSPVTPPPSILLIQGLMNRPNTRIKRGNITIVPYPKDEELVPALLGAKHIIARSGYSTIMDLDALGLLNNKSQIINHKLELIPTPGQPEQEYLAKRIEQKTLFS
jgi:predicted glycosyltransferase